jgi:hypothetical protein
MMTRCCIKPDSRSQLLSGFADFQRLLLAEMKANKQRRRGGKQNLRPGSHAATPGEEPKLADLGVTKTQSSRWQRTIA